MLPAFYPISDEIIHDIYVASPLATWLFDILIQFDGNLIILINDVVMYLISLLFLELLGPDQLCQDIVNPNNIGLG